MPNCAACGKPITFYMHQEYVGSRMTYWHPDCCPCRLSVPDA